MSVLLFLALSAVTAVANAPIERRALKANSSPSSNSAICSIGGEQIIVNGNKEFMEMLVQLHYDCRLYDKRTAEVDDKVAREEEDDDRRFVSSADETDGADKPNGEKASSTPTTEKGNVTDKLDDGASHSTKSTEPSRRGQIKMPQVKKAEVSNEVAGSAVDESSRNFGSLIKLCCSVVLKFLSFALFLMFI